MGKLLEEHFDLRTDSHMVHLYVCSELGSLESSTGDAMDGKFDGFLLGDSIGSVDGLDIITNEVSELGLPMGKLHVLVKI